MNEYPGTNLFSILQSIIDSRYKRELQFALTFDSHHQVGVLGIPKRSAHNHISQRILHITFYHDTRLRASNLFENKKLSIPLYFSNIMSKTISIWVGLSYNEELDII